MSHQSYAFYLWIRCGHNGVASATCYRTPAGHADPSECEGAKHEPYQAAVTASRCQRPAIGCLPACRRADQPASRNTDILGRPRGNAHLLAGRNKRPRARANQELKSHRHGRAEHHTHSDSGSGDCPTTDVGAVERGNYLLPANWGGPPDGLLPMVDGSFTYAFIPGAASVERYLLHRGVAFGDLNSDQVEDAVVILMHVSAGTGTFYHLAAVLNEHGQPLPLAPVFLGHRIIIEQVDISTDEVALEFKAYGEEEPFGSTPTLQMKQRYRLHGETLELVDSGVQNADDVVNDTTTPDAVAIVFPEGERTATYSGRSRPFGLDRYVLQAEAGQPVTSSELYPSGGAFGPDSQHVI